MTDQVAKVISRPLHSLAVLLALLALLGCPSRRATPQARLQDASQPTELARSPASVPLTPAAREVLSTRLEVDLSTHRGHAVVELGPSATPGGSLEVGDLELLSVSSGGAPLSARRDGRWLHLGLPPAEGATEVVIDYAFRLNDHNQGALPGGMTLTWPYFCGNIFPCHSDPADGATFELSLAGVPAGQSAVFPRALTSEAPAYMLAWAVGDYERHDLGTTSAGTRVALWCSPGDCERGLRGAARLAEIFDWFERTLGPYPFGQEVGTVGVDWRGAAYGGMEHHPFWHIERAALEQPEIHAHEAAHGWFGNGVRLRCWEDFVLSEGAASYLTARALEAVLGQTQGDALWLSYEERLRRALASARTPPAWPEGCGQVDVLDIFSDLPYMQGALFLRALEARVGREALDQGLRTFYLRYQGQAASLGDLLEHLRQQTGYDAAACADAWLRQRTIPAEQTCP